MKLSLLRPARYRLKRGQTISEAAETFGVTPRALALACPSGGDAAGCVLLVPPPAGDLYRVRGGESKTLLCGSPEAFEKKNGTRHLYIGQTVYL